MFKIGVLIPVFNKLNYTKDCLRNLYSTLNKNEELLKTFEIIVVDDASTDGTSEWVKSNYPQVHLLPGNGDLWWSGGINVGAKFAIENLRCRYVLLWNNDIKVEQEYIDNLLRIIDQNSDDIIIGSKIYADPEGKTVWSMGGIFNPRNGHSSMIGYQSPDADHLKIPIEADWLTGMGTLVPASIIQKIGYWDELNYPQYLGDMEFTYRAKINGFRIIAYPEITIWNDTENTGWIKKDSLRTVLKMLSNKRSPFYLKANLKFYKTYSESMFSYSFLCINYFKFIGGFLKWKFLKLLGIKNRSEFN